MVAVDRLVGLLEPSLAQGPVGQALAAGLRGLVLDGRLVAGSRLPAERRLASALGISRATVTTAYDRLRAQGFLVSRQGSGTVVRLPPHEIARPDETGPPGHPDLIDLTVAALPAPPVLARVAATAVNRLPALMGTTGLDPLGLPELRAAIAERYTERGIPTAAEQILISNGALHSWNLLLDAFVSPGAGVLVEQPTYPGVLDAVRAHHARALPLPVEAAGWDLGQLPRPARAPVLAHVTPDGQNPTGLWAGEAARRGLLRALDPATTLVVDETLIDLPGGTGPAPRPAALGRRGRDVVSIGSMSKTFWAGLRVGWVRGPAELVRRLAAARAGRDLATAALEQLVALDLMAFAEQVVAERRALLERNARALSAALAEHAPDWSWDRPGGGLVLWVELGGLSSTVLAARALEHGVRITPGTRFSVAGTHDRWTRLPFVDPPQVLHEAVRRLCAAAAGVGPARRQRPGGPAQAWTA